MPAPHDCLRPDFDDGLIQVGGGCDCAGRLGRITKEGAEQLISYGRAVWKKQCRGDGRVVERHDIILLRPNMYPPCARTISARDIERAGDDAREYERILQYGQMSLPAIRLIHE